MGDRPPYALRAQKSQSTLNMGAVVNADVTHRAKIVGGNAFRASICELVHTLGAAAYPAARSER